MYEVKQVQDTKNNKLRWLATDINLNCYTLGVLSLMIELEILLRVKLRKLVHSLGGFHDFEIRESS